MPPKPKAPAADTEGTPENMEGKPETPKTGYGKFEYVNQTLYIGEWCLNENGHKVKHGHGKIIFPGTVNSHGNQVGGEEYDG